MKQPISLIYMCVRTSFKNTWASPIQQFLKFLLLFIYIFIQDEYRSDKIYLSTAWSRRLKWKILNILKYKQGKTEKIWKMMLRINI